MEILSKLFGSEERVKLLRLFLFNPESIFLANEIAERAQIDTKTLKKELVLFFGIGLIKHKPFVKEINHVVRDKVVQKKVKGTGYFLDQKFPYLISLKNLLITVSLYADDEIAGLFIKTGKIKLLIVAGVFIQDWSSRLDLLVVGDDISQNKIEKVVRKLEADIGKEIAYSVLDTSEFEYRIGVYDKLVRDVLDFSHKKIIDKLGV